jgi:toxin ParE1/3/4
VSRRFIVRPEAEDDIVDAYRWFEERRDGLGDDFLSVVEQAFETIERSPEAFRVVHKQVRRVLTRRFPFAAFSSSLQTTSP